MYKINLFTLLTILTVFSACQKPLNTECNIIPAPQQVVPGSGHFTIGSETHIAYSDPGMETHALSWQSAIAAETGRTLPVVKKDAASKHSIFLVIDAGMSDEAYQLEIDGKKTICKASAGAGAFYALQSFIQLLDNGSVPCMSITDKPRFGWRGLMLDESRHFFGKDVVKQQLDIMARLKMNRYHWHLTDETGWRIEIKQYPRLTGTGAVGNWSDRNAAPTFYTQEDIREIVEYARERHIMVIPEIDMPGHATAASRAYPEVSAGGTGRWAGFTFHPTRETTYEFIGNVMKEVAGLFPAPYVHIGGDEVHFGNQIWFTDPVIQKFIKDNKLKNEVGLEHYFVRRATEIVNNLGKKIIGWDEIVESGVSKEQAIIMWWRHDKEQQLTKVLKEGYDVILTPRIPCYFDFVQDDSQKIGRRWAGAFNPLPVVYAFPDSLKPIKGREKQVLGMQANVWAERIADKKRLDYMTYPRLAAMAEDAWTDQDRKDYPGFEIRIREFLKYLDTMDIYYFNPFDKESTPEPWGPEKADVLAEG